VSTLLQPLFVTGSAKTAHGRMFSHTQRHINALSSFTINEVVLSGLLLYLNWRETCFLATCLEDGFKGKKLLHNVRKFDTRNFNHW